MNRLAIRSEARRRVRSQSIRELEIADGFEPTVEPTGLPSVSVVRNPEGDWMMGNRWTTVGFDERGWEIREVKGATKRACIRRAKKRLRAMVERDLTDPVEVHP